MPEISVGITAYNLENFLPTCFQDLQSQTIQDFEIIVLDDCSTDGTAPSYGKTWTVIRDDQY
jgi:glycosyltransferase involved in cell wall biosynthesis